MKKSKFYPASLLKGTIASSLAMASLMPNSQSAINNTASAEPAISTEQSSPEQSIFSQEIIGTNEEHILSFPKNAPTEWSAVLEREFRQLAFEEVRGKIDADGAKRLKELDLLRERLESPRSAEEVLFQLKRDRHLEKMAKYFGKYAEFKKAANRQRFAARKGS